MRLWVLKWLLVWSVLVTSLGYWLDFCGVETVFSDINAAIEEAIWRRYNGEQQRHFCLVQRGNMIAVVQDRDNKYPNAMWTTRNFLG